MQKNFSRPLKIDDLPQSEQHYHLEATLKDCKMLAEVLKVPEVAAVKADIRLKYTHADHRLDVNGHVFAALKLESVVSLELFDESYDFDFSLCYDTAATYDSQREEAEDWTTELPDVVIGGQIDLGDIVIEQIALKLDDYPRKQGEVFCFESEFDEDDESANNPFAALAKLKK